MNEKDNYTARDQSAELLENAQLEIKEKEELKEKIETFKRLGNKARELAEYGEKGLTERVDRYFGNVEGIVNSRLGSAERFFAGAENARDDVEREKKLEQGREQIEIAKETLDKVIEKYAAIDKKKEIKNPVEGKPVSGPDYDYENTYAANYEKDEKDPKNAEVKRAFKAHREGRIEKDSDWLENEAKMRGEGQEEKTEVKEEKVEAKESKGKKSDNKEFIREYNKRFEDSVRDFDEQVRQIEEDARAQEEVNKKKASELKHRRTVNEVISSAKKKIAGEKHVDDRELKDAMDFVRNDFREDDGSKEKYDVDDVINEVKGWGKIKTVEEIDAEDKAGKEKVNKELDERWKNMDDIVEAMEKIEKEEEDGKKEKYTEEEAEEKERLRRKLLSEHPEEVREIEEKERRKAEDERVDSVIADIDRALGKNGENIDFTKKYDDGDYEHRINKPGSENNGAIYAAKGGVEAINSGTDYKTKGKQDIWGTDKRNKLFEDANNAKIKRDLEEKTGRKEFAEMFGGEMREAERVSLKKRFKEFVSNKPQLKKALVALGLSATIGLGIGAGAAARDIRRSEKNVASGTGIFETGEMPSQEVNNVSGGAAEIVFDGGEQTEIAGENGAVFVTQEAAERNGANVQAQQNQMPPVFLGQTEGLQGATGQNVVKNTVMAERTAFEVNFAEQNANYLRGLDTSAMEEYDAAEDRLNWGGDVKRILCEASDE